MRNDEALRLHDFPAIVAVVSGKGLQSLPLFPRLPEGRRLEFYHYTDRAGFEGLTAADAQWLPSLGARASSLSPRPLPGVEDPVPPDVRSADSISAELASLVALMARGPFEEIADLTSLYYGPGWYATDLRPGAGTDELLDHLWGGDPNKRHRTEYWIKVRVSEFKVVVPDLTRPRLRFIPIQDRVGLSAEGSLYGQSLSTVELVAGGRRTEGAGGAVHTERLHRRRREVVPVFQFLVEGWPRLPEDQQGKILRYFGVGETVTWPPDSAEGQAVDLVHKLAQRGDYLAALERSEELIARYPSVADLWSNRGVVLAKLGRREAALDCYERALEIRPHYPQARLNLAASLVRLGRPEQALACLNPLISRAPGDAAPWFNRGSALMLLGEWTAAARSFERFVELAPDHPNAPRARTLGRQCRSRRPLGWLGRGLRRAVSRRRRD